MLVMRLLYLLYVALLVFSLHTRFHFFFNERMLYIIKCFLHKVILNPLLKKFAFIGNAGLQRGRDRGSHLLVTC